MRTQAHDLKAKIKEVDDNIRYLQWKQVDPQSEIFKYLSNRRDVLVSTLNNIR